MVFHGRCFMIEEREYEARTQTKSTSTKTFHTAFSDLNHGMTSSFFNLSEKPSDLRVFTVAELKTATKNFCLASKIGSVFKGVIKRLEDPFREIQVAAKYADGVLQGHKEWITEINVLGVARHPNLVKLIGYCAEDNDLGTQLLLVYEYMENGSVRHHLSTRAQTPLSWTMRLKIAQDTARGLAYLHEQMDFQIIFRYFKSSNILLDGEWNAKLSDFGVARLGPQEGLTHISTAFAGTVKYAAPEYIETGRVSSKSDVWSYGVFLYELITGRCPLDGNRPQNEQKLLEWEKIYLDTKSFTLIIDSRLKGKYSLDSAQKLSLIANCCLSRDPKSRPTMSEVLEMVNQLITEVDIMPTQLLKGLENTKHKDENNQLGMSLWKLLKS